MKITAIICAAGKGERAGLGKNKVLAPLFGAPVLWHTLKRFSFADEIIVACSERDREKIFAISAPFGAKLANGGETRTLSVYNALKAATGDIVLIHDGARPFVLPDTVSECVESVKKYSSGICAVPVTDTVAVCSGGEITGVPPRESMYALQTPQGFYRAEILSAYEKAVKSGESFTDDSSVYLKYIGKPHICGSDKSNTKLTYPEDFNIDERGIFGVQFPTDKVGFGVDVHAFGEGSYVTLCGVKIPCNGALIAHSDGDVAVHAVMDAVLSAAGLKDIGHYFPDTDPKYTGADSIKMLEQVVKLALDRGYVPSNLSVSIQAEKPRLAKYIDEMKRNLSAALGISEDNIAVAAGTCEGLGFVGEGKGIAAYCAVTLTNTKQV